MRAPAFIIIVAILLTGCRTLDDRINQHRAEFDALDHRTQQMIRGGEVAVGFTLDMAYMALGEPTKTETTSTGQVVWQYHREPATAANETIRAGYRRRVIYDPVKRTDTVITEAIDKKAFPNLVPYTLRLTFENNRLISLERIPDW